MPIRVRSFLLVVLGALLVSAPMLVMHTASAHTAACHTDHTCPSDVSPPDYACGDNPSAVCSAPNSPTPGQPDAAPPLGGPPSAADCGSFEIYYTGAICKQVLGVTSPPAAGSPGASVLPSSSPAPSVAPATSFPPFTAPPALPVDDSLGTTALAVWAFVLAASVFLVAATWRMFVKAGQPGWAALIPIYGTIVYLKLASRPWWWILITWLVVPVFIVNRDVARAFGRSSNFGIAMTFLPFIFMPILAFGHSDYRRPHRGPKPMPLSG